MFLERRDFVEQLLTPLAELRLERRNFFEKFLFSIRSQQPSLFLSTPQVVDNVDEACRTCARAVM
eukprot:3077938-Prymnesium_polylepis.2